MEKETQAAITERVEIVDRVTQGVRVFLAGAIGLGFAVSAMAFFMLPGDGGGTIVAAKNQPLKVMDILRAVSVRDPLETIQFYQQDYYAGSTKVFEQPSQGSGVDTTLRNGRVNEPLSIRVQTAVSQNFGSKGLFGIRTAQAQATTFSVEPVPKFTGFSNQYILIWYRLVGDQNDRLLTLCLGQAEKTRIYVGTDGSTYTDANLTRRTTVRSCRTLSSLNQGVEQVSEASAVIDRDNYGLHNLVRSTRVLGRFDNGILQSGSTNPETEPALLKQIIGNFRTPIWVGFSPATDEQNNFIPTVPSAVFRLTDITTKPGAIIVQYLCHPGGPYDTETTGPVFYFDRNGDAYADMFLQNRIMTQSCAQILAAAYSPNRIVNTTPTLNIGDNHGIWVGSGSYLYGVINAGGFENRQGQQGVFERYPLFLILTGASEKINIPAQRVRITDDTGRVTTLCWGPFTGVNAGDKSTVVFYSTTGQGYHDVLLTKPITCVLPPSSGGGVIKIPE